MCYMCDENDSVYLLFTFQKLGTYTNNNVEAIWNEKKKELYANNRIHYDVVEGVCASIVMHASNEESSDA